MGHMNAMDRIKRQSKRERDDDALARENIIKGATLAMKSVAISLYELHGFHNKRNGRVLQDACDRVSEYINRYKGEFTEDAMDKYIRDIGLDITIYGK